MTFYPGKLTIDLAALRDNYALLREKAGAGCTVAGVVKANGYGLGLAPVVRILAKAGCETFFVATPEEGARVREILPNAQIAVLGGLYKGAENFYAAHNLIPVIGSLEECARYKNRAGDSKPVVLHFDTGMNRLGFGQDETPVLLAEPERLEGLDVKMIMSHFACADEKGHEMNEAQYERFKAVAAHFPEAQKSLANSSGVFRDPRYHFDVARPGMALYGLNPTPEAPNPMRRVISLDVRVLQIREVKTGETTGYGASYRHEKDTVTATVALGYADGILRALSNKGHLYWQGRALRILGRVSMDTITLDLGALAENARPQIGDYLEVIGPHQSADDLATQAGTIGYEILTSLGDRYERVYLDDQAETISS